MVWAQEAVLSTGNTQGSRDLLMTQDTRLALCLMGQLVAALPANDPDTFKQWLADGVHEMGEPGVVELMVDWMVSLLTQDEADRLVGWHLGVSV